MAPDDSGNHRSPWDEHVRQLLDHARQQWSRQRGPDLELQLYGPIDEDFGMGLSEGGARERRLDTAEMDQPLGGLLVGALRNQTEYVSGGD